MTVSLFFGVTALAADRFLAIHLHLRYQELVTHRRVVAVVTSIWLFSAIFSPFWLWNPKIYSILNGIIQTACLILTELFNCKIYLPLRRHANTARQIKSAVVTFYVFLVFLVCHLPYISINTVYAITKAITPRNPLLEYTLALVFLNSSLNPLVYCWKMRHIRHVTHS